MPTNIFLLIYLDNMSTTFLNLMVTWFVGTSSLTSVVILFVYSIFVEYSTYWKSCKVRILVKTEASICVGK